MRWQRCLARSKSLSACWHCDEPRQSTKPAEAWFTGHPLGCLSSQANDHVTENRKGLTKRGLWEWRDKENSMGWTQKRKREKIQDQVQQTRRYHEGKPSAAGRGRRLAASVLPRDQEKNETLLRSTGWPDSS